MGKRKGLIVGLCGKARVGKDKFTEYLVNIFSSEHNREFKTTAFAHRLKQMCLEHFDLNREQLWGDSKEELTEFGKTESGKLGLSSNPNDYWTPREIMQAVGSFYRSIDYDFWVKQVDKKWEYAGYPDVIITDVRHVNECEYVKNNGVLIRIIRSRSDKIHGMGHESETALDNKPQNYFDIEINNDGTLEELQIAAYNTAKAILLLENMNRQGRSYNGKR